MLVIYLKKYHTIILKFSYIYIYINIFIDKIMKNISIKFAKVISM